jgi:hypothetical protein
MLLRLEKLSVNFGGSIRSSSFLVTNGTRNNARAIAERIDSASHVSDVNL